ncbi:MAG TPA: hypothetical protein PLD20_23290 [Blastocatellia bacterium]|nr:hypothetical protein [Blastocatellia bacterium]HMV86362.1 hypothetical protein [Blastocatellia bacterium]HMX27864.1 hypothetical protein [Blastocatellia bacterium]HMZ20877.1 hypothetical protein [Blastocatellia bacterium]HNG31589.1 hypothetical protein [Blastocatellia bacterium]
MTKKLTTKIEIETQEVLVIHRSSFAAPPSCPDCSGNVMLSPEQVADLTGTSQRTIFRWIELGIVHFRETPEGKLYVCVNSFPTAMEMKGINPPPH